MSKSVCEYMPDSRLIHFQEEDAGEFYVAPESIVTIEDSDDKDITCTVVTVGNAEPINLTEISLAKVVDVWAEAREARRP
jgi:hypothetical protein